MGHLEEDFMDPVAAAIVDPAGRCSTGIGLAVARPMLNHKIYPHGLPEEVQPGLWRVVGSLPIPIKRNMFIYRMADGGLLLHSVVAMHEPGMRALEALGTPAVMVIPHPKHTMDATFYKERYPQLRVFGCADAQKKLPDLPFDATPQQGLPSLHVGAELVPGMKLDETVVELPIGTGGTALLFTDLVYQDEGNEGSFLMKLFGPPHGAGVARVLKLTQIKDKSLVKPFLRKLALQPISLVAGCHGGVVTRDCSAWLNRAAEQL